MSRKERKEAVPEKDSLQAKRSETGERQVGRKQMWESDAHIACV